MCCMLQRFFYLWTLPMWGQQVTKNIFALFSFIPMCLPIEGHPIRYLLAQNQQEKHHGNGINIRHLRVTLMTSFWCLFCQLWIYFTHCSGVSLVHFEQVNAKWDCSSLIYPFRVILLGIYLFKVINKKRNPTATREIRSELAIKTPVRH